MNICIYGASSNEIDPKYISAVENLGELMAKRGHTLVYGGGAGGLMGAAARGVHRCGGKIIGVAPSFFKVDGMLYDKCTELIYTDTMRERKQIMEDSSEAYTMVPGGIGTFDEFFEILTLKQLGRHNKPIAILNIDGYYNSIFSMVEHAIELHFMKPGNKLLYGVSEEPEGVLDYIDNYTFSNVELQELKNI